MPVIAKTLGRLSGKMVGYSHAYREKVERILDESGNDYEIFESAKTIGHTVTSPEDTVKQVTESIINA